MELGSIDSSQSSTVSASSLLLKKDFNWRAIEARDLGSDLGSDSGMGSTMCGVWIVWGVITCVWYYKLCVLICLS